MVNGSPFTWCTRCHSQRCGCALFAELQRKRDRLEALWLREGWTTSAADCFRSKGG